MEQLTEEEFEALVKKLKWVVEEVDSLVSKIPYPSTDDGILRYDDIVTHPSLIRITKVVKGKGNETMILNQREGR